MDTEPTTAESLTDATEGSETISDGADLVEEELLVEEISIDGMCGVY